MKKDDHYMNIAEYNQIMMQRQVQQQMQLQRQAQENPAQ